MTMKFTLVVTVLAIVCFAGSATAQRDSTQAAMEQIERILSGTRKPRTRAGLVQHLARELSKNCDNPSSKIVQLISGRFHMCVSLYCNSLMALNWIPLRSLVFAKIRSCFQYS